MDMEGTPRLGVRRRGILPQEDIGEGSIPAAAAAPAEARGGDTLQVLALQLEEEVGIGVVVRFAEADSHKEGLLLLVRRRRRPGADTSPRRSSFFAL
jgi:hypothetical protein